MKSEDYQLAINVYIISGLPLRRQRRNNITKDDTSQSGRIRQTPISH